MSLLQFDHWASFIFEEFGRHVMADDCFELSQGIQIQAIVAAVEQLSQIRTTGEPPCAINHI